MSQICSLMGRPSTVTIRAPNSTPMVRSWTGWNLLSVNCRSKHDFPTPKRQYKRKPMKIATKSNLTQKKKIKKLGMIGGGSHLCLRWLCTWRDNRTTWLMIILSKGGWFFLLGREEMWKIERDEEEIVGTRHRRAFWLILFFEVSRWRSYISYSHL